VLAELQTVQNRLDEAEGQLQRLRGDVEHHTEVIVRHEEPISRHEFLLATLEANIAEVGPAIVDLVRQIDVVKDMLELGQRQVLTRLFDSLGEMRSELQQAIDVMREEFRDAETWRTALDEVWLRVAQLDLYLTEVRREHPKLASPAVLAEVGTGFETLYSVFEEVFRGPRSIVRERVRAYLLDIEAIRTAGPVLDVGCGRGEFLEVLAEADVPAYGVDLNRAMVEQNRVRGLDVRLEDAFTHLRSVEPGSLRAVAAIHVVEHLTTDQLVELLELASGALGPGGQIIIETPNPENLSVAAHSFYLDPTHRRPVPPQLLGFLIGSVGFTDIEVRRLARDELGRGIPSPKPGEPWSEDVAILVDVVNQNLFGPPDYAVLARRP
jgi:O-antigen chain-terminating methyltransferase